MDCGGGGGGGWGSGGEEDGGDGGEGGDYGNVKGHFWDVSGMRGEEGVYQLSQGAAKRVRKRGEGGGGDTACG